MPTSWEALMDNPRRPSSVMAKLGRSNNDSESFSDSSRPRYAPADKVRSNWICAILQPSRARGVEQRPPQSVAGVSVHIDIRWHPTIPYIGRTWPYSHLPWRRKKRHPVRIWPFPDLKKENASLSADVFRRGERSNSTLRASHIAPGVTGSYPRMSNWARKARKKPSYGSRILRG